MNQILVDNGNLHTRIKDKLATIEKKVKEATENEPVNIISNVGRT